MPIFMQQNKKSARITRCRRIVVSLISEEKFPYDEQDDAGDAEQSNDECAHPVDGDGEAEDSADQVDEPEECSAEQCIPDELDDEFDRHQKQLGYDE